MDSSIWSCAAGSGGASDVPVSWGHASGAREQSKTAGMMQRGQCGTGFAEAAGLVKNSTSLFQGYRNWREAPPRCLDASQAKLERQSCQRRTRQGSRGVLLLRVTIIVSENLCLNFLPPAFSSRSCRLSLIPSPAYPSSVWQAFRRRWVSRGRTLWDCPASTPSLSLPGEGARVHE